MKPQKSPKMPIKCQTSSHCILQWATTGRVIALSCKKYEAVIVWLLMTNRPIFESQRTYFASRAAQAWPCTLSSLKPLGPSYLRQRHLPLMRAVPLSIRDADLTPRQDAKRVLISSKTAIKLERSKRAWIEWAVIRQVRSPLVASFIVSMSREWKKYHR